MLEALILLTALSPAAANAPLDPLAEARNGKQQCVSPNRETKTCSGIASYTIQPDGSFTTQAQILLVPQPAIAMEVTSRGRVEGNSTCGTIAKADYERAKITLDGAEADASVEQAVKAQILAGIAAMDGKKACGTDRKDGDLIVSDVTVDGKVQPELAQRYIWVSPSDGYRLGM